MASEWSVLDCSGFPFTLLYNIEGNKRWKINFLLFFLARFAFHRQPTTFSRPATTTSWCSRTSKETSRCHFLQSSSPSTQTKSFPVVGTPQTSRSCQHQPTKLPSCGLFRLSKADVLHKLYIFLSNLKRFLLFFYGKLDQKISEQFPNLLYYKKKPKTWINFNTVNEDSILIYHERSEQTEKNLCYFYRQTKIKLKLIASLIKNRCACFFIFEKIKSNWL